MRITNYLLALVLLSVSFSLNAQTTNIPLWFKENWFLNRLEIKAGTNNDLNLSTVKPYMRKVYVEVADSVRTLLLAGQNPYNLTKVDQYNLNRFECNNKEYSKFDLTSMPDWQGKWSTGKYFYPTAGNMLEVNTKDFYLSVNPVLNVQIGKESDYDPTLFVNAKGAMFRGLIAKKIGFDFYLTDNQERGPMQYREFLNTNRQVPGAGFWKDFKTEATDYFDARGSVSTNVTKYINVQFGFDRNFIGNGYRSLFLSDFGNSTLFLKLNTRIWKLNYTNLFMELFPSYTKAGDNLLNRKYAAMHHLGINVTKWLNVGLFESIMFGRVNHFDFSYLVPVIFLRSIEGNNGSPDNANVGLDLKANLGHSVQLYGQFLLDELNISILKEDKTWWGNKFGTQLGLKYVDVAKIKNLDLQLEWNRIRPFTYSHRDSVTSYISYNQPLAHPLGANFSEFIGILRYQPIPKLYVTARAIVYKQGRDSLSGYDAGYNPNIPYTFRNREVGYKMFDGVVTNVANTSLTASYEILENLFIDLNGTFRMFKQYGDTKNTSMLSVGIRLNGFRREYDY